MVNDVSTPFGISSPYQAVNYIPKQSIFSTNFFDFHIFCFSITIFHMHRFYQYHIFKHSNW